MNDDGDIRSTSISSYSLMAIDNCCLLFGLDIPLIHLLYSLGFVDPSVITEEMARKSQYTRNKSYLPTLDPVVQHVQYSQRGSSAALPHLSGRQSEMVVVVVVVVVVVLVATQGGRLDGPLNVVVECYSLV